MIFLLRAIVICTLVLLCTMVPALAQEQLSFKEWFGNNQGTLVIHDPDNDTYIIHNLPRAQEALSPHSTFKIPNSLIALDTGVITNTNQVLPWDKIKHPPEKTWTPALMKAWGKPHSMTTAFQNSAIWFYQDIAEKIDTKTMSQYLKCFQYGNQDISGGINRFWLNSSLKISALDQVAFLEHFYNNQFGLNTNTTARVKQMMLVEDTTGYRLYVKTGLGPIGSPAPLAWYVGFIEVKPSLKPYFFALNIQGESESDVVTRRKTIVLQTLKAMGLMQP